MQGRILTDDPNAKLTATLNLLQENFMLFSKIAEGALSWNIVLDETCFEVELIFG